MTARYCKKCKLVFSADTCPGGHAIFMCVARTQLRLSGRLRLPPRSCALVLLCSCALVLLCSAQLISPAGARRYTKKIPEGAAVAEPTDGADAEPDDRPAAGGAASAPESQPQGAAAERKDGADASEDAEPDWEAMRLYELKKECK
eukprot:COSAG04_NODE_11706_length_693_cov_1.015152_1_plen_145_part_10